MEIKKKTITKEVVSLNLEPKEAKLLKTILALDVSLPEILAKQSNMSPSKIMEVQQFMSKLFDEFIDLGI